MCDAKPVSVIIPAFNEEGTITKCVESLTNGDYPLDKLEFIIADGDSSVAYLFCSLARSSMNSVQPELTSVVTRV